MHQSPELKTDQYHTPHTKNPDRHQELLVFSQRQVHEASGWSLDLSTAEGSRDLSSIQGLEWENVSRASVTRPFPHATSPAYSNSLDE